MLILNINGPINVGKSTVCKILVNLLKKSVFIEVDDLLSDEEQETLGLSLKEGWAERLNRLNKQLSDLKQSKEYETIIFAYPITEKMYQSWKAFEDEQTKFLNITLAPSLEECLKNRGTRELTERETNRIHQMYDEGYHNRPYTDFIINNEHQTPTETAEVIRGFISKNYLIQASDYLGKQVSVVMDRPLGSKHPKHSFVYPINYGYVPNTISGDREELDAYILGVSTPEEKFTGTCIGVIHRTDDNDHKLVVVPTGTNLTDDEIENAVNFQEKWFHHTLIRG